ncbi:lipoic acid synthetase [Marinilabilia salmonicolor]|jgi:lipoic acid synthetase|uniref:lipoyl synthase n=1 Tax=Marinilabilia salmonicolor TaxID=989 RepID=UPI000D04917F|nr:lipoyl synthase [Marinilabilia salmonicolor]PRZ02014.1 lipoic acid synthetase [Marinilabilia salmonicolor]
MNIVSERKRKPAWLKIQLPNTSDYNWMNKTIRDHKLHTICTSGKCPNSAECWGNGTATFMILGDICTRSCKFCNVKTGKPDAVDFKEPFRIARSIQIMKLKHAVITSVDRDDLEDGGAGVWAETIRKVKEMNPGITQEVLIPDFNGLKHLIQQVIDAKPEVVSHNLETVRRLTPQIRSKAKYDLSLKVLEYIASTGVVPKSGIMVGLGEKPEEVLETMDDLIAAGVKVLTIGQYLQPSPKHLEVVEYVTPEQFAIYEEEGLKRGFKYVESGPLVRSSYHAEKHINALK